MSPKELDILIVEDEPFQREMLRDSLLQEGHRIQEAENGEKALQILKRSSFDLLLLDFRMHGMNGIEVLKAARQLCPDLEAILITAYGAIETAVEAMKAGASDYLTKPIDLDELSMSIARIAEHRTLLRENEILRQELKAKGVSTNTIQYTSQKMSKLIQLAGRIAPSQATVLIQGETGTGKELLARLIHNLSSRSDKPLIAVNCAAMPETLLESELFGHEKGAFTGAIQRRIGRFEQAEGGTLFLDEIGELSLPVQVKLLRFLQEREFQRVGGERTHKADVRIISATHQDLDASVKEGTFREDLFYRINVIHMEIPPLRERREDIAPLLEHFTRKFAVENHRKIEGISREAVDLLTRYDYPGNVRELENIIERAVVVCRGHVISREDLAFPEAFNPQAGPAAEPDPIPPGETLQQAVESLERRMIGDALLQSGTNQSQAARQLGLSERMLRYKLKKYGFK